MKPVAILFIFIFFSINAAAQKFNLNGKVTDDKGDVVPFASVYIKNTSKGTSANSEGIYRLRFEAGIYDLVFKTIGYRQQIVNLNISSDTSLNVKLIPEIYTLNDVIIRSDGEDAAYEIIRKAIAKRKSHLREVDQYTTEVYIKGMQKLLAAPKKFLGRDMNKIGREIGLDSNRQGIIYLSESESKLSYIQPDHFKEEMISSKVSGSNRAFSFNRASDIKVNFYENFQDWEGLSNRPIISPLADNALFYYRYKYLGSAVENGQSINKIQVIPRRSADPVFRGNIYILENSWRLHSVDLFLTKEANINFVDTLKINQEFFPAGNKGWMPSSVKFDFTGGLLGFRFGGYFLAVYKNYDLNPKLNLQDFAEVLRITKEVNKKDSAYWLLARPIPLTEEEKTDYRKKDTLAAKRESRPYLDSLDKANNKFKPLPFLIGSGYNPRNRFKKEYYNFSSLRNAIFYNTVEGFGFNYTASYRKQTDSVSSKFLSLTGNIRYGFASEKFYASMTGNRPYGKIDYGFNIGTDVLDLNNLGSITAFGNSVNSLFYERNLLKLYEKKFINLSASRRLSSGLVATATTEWANRKNLYNLTNFTFIDDKNLVFTSNNPLNPVNDLALFTENQSFKIGLRATYEFGKAYATYPEGRVYLPSKYPLIGLNYSRSFKNVFGSDTRFDYLSFDLTKKDIKLGLYGKTAFWLGAGKFLNSDQLYYPDYKHFIGTQSLGFVSKINTFLFLDYYRFSTADKYFEGHVEHNFSGFITNKLPLLRKLKLQELAGFNHLGTSSFKNYNEVYFGLQYLNFKGLYGISFQRGKQADKGFRVAYGF
ncbi:MAG: carboxypeptidase-like regulatory domain-containing protein [Flavobacterium sp.]|nr:carboxypeptidase-like regulatory domain-containing protein [Pedobacter sp.]